MARHLHFTLIILSLTVFIASAILWPLSWRGGGRNLWGRPDPKENFYVQSSCGWIILAGPSSAAIPSPRPSLSREGFESEIAGVSWYRFYYGTTFWELRMRYRSLLVAFGVASLLGFSLIVRPYLDKKRHRQQQGLCINCGYDLRGGHVCCPECGAELASIPAVKTP